jgi:triacylglycerol lipase
MASRLKTCAPMRLHHFLSLFLFTAPFCAAGSPSELPLAGRKIVLVHGFLETGSTFKMLRKRLEKRGAEVLVPRLKHNDGRGGLENLAVHLKQDIEKKFGPEAPIRIVAFSMGGLVSREYLQNQGGAERCENFITVSSPHHGTNAAWCYPSQGVKEMRPGSSFLNRLRQTEARLGKMPVTSYHTPMDLIILPPTSSVWDRAENLEYPVILHPMMLTSRRVLDDIAQRLEK